MSSWDGDPAFATVYYMAGDIRAVFTLMRVATVAAVE